MKNISLHLFAAVLLILSAATASAQNGTTTPYSAFGYGMLRDDATSTQRAMGTVGYAMNSGRQINAMNPASYAAIDSLTFLFDMGASFDALWQKDYKVGATASSVNGRFDYVTMQFPVGRYCGASIGLLPYSTVGYAFGDKIDNGIDSRQGSGSINKFYGGFAVRPFKGFTLGTNVSYLFGTILNETYAQISSTQSSLFQKQFTVRDYDLNFGVQYSLPIGVHKATVGLTYSPAKTFLGTSRVVHYDTGADSKPQFDDEISLKGNYSRPESWGAGINYAFNRQLMVEADFTYQPWSKAKYDASALTPSTQSFADRRKYAAGLQYTPDFRGSYLRRVNYRIGAYRNDDYLCIDDNQLREYALTLGAGFPVPEFKTTVNVSLEWKNRQTAPQQLIRENYLSLTVGINFNEMWFQKNKIY